MPLRALDRTKRSRHEHRSSRRRWVRAFSRGRRRQRAPRRRGAGRRLGDGGVRSRASAARSTPVSCGGRGGQTNGLAVCEAVSAEAGSCAGAVDKPPATAAKSTRASAAPPASWRRAGSSLPLRETRTSLDLERRRLRGVAGTFAGHAARVGRGGAARVARAARTAGGGSGSSTRLSPGVPRRSTERASWRQAAVAGLGAGGARARRGGVHRRRHRLGTGHRGRPHGQRRDLGTPAIRAALRHGDQGWCARPPATAPAGEDQGPGQDALQRRGRRNGRPDGGLPHPRHARRKRLREHAGSSRRARRSPFQWARSSAAASSSAARSRFPSGASTRGETASRNSSHLSNDGCPSCP